MLDELPNQTPSNLGMYRMLTLVYDHTTAAGKQVDSMSDYFGRFVAQLSESGSRFNGSLRLRASEHGQIAIHTNGSARALHQSRMIAYVL